MQRLTSFLFGCVVGGIVVIAALKYHLVRADDGLHLVAKMPPQFANTYVDIREFGFEQWQAHPELAVALGVRRPDGTAGRGGSAVAAQVGRRVLPRPEPLTSQRPDSRHAVEPARGPTRLTDHLADITRTVCRTIKRRDGASRYSPREPHGMGTRRMRDGW